MSGVPAGRTIGPLGSPSWVAEYRRRVDGVTRELNAARVYVVWIGLPITRGDGYRRGFRVVNSVLSAVARRHARMATYVDTWGMFSNHGRYADYLPNGHGQLVLMRAADGVQWVRDLCRRLQVPRLSAFGVQREDFADIANKASTSSSMKGNPVAFTADQLIEILESAC